MARPISRGRGITLAILGASLWGGSGAGAQALFAHSDVSALWLVTVRLVFAGLGLMAIVLVTRFAQLKRLATTKKYWGWLLAFTFLGMVNSQLTYLLAIQTSNAPTATVLQFLQPAIIIVAVALKNKKIPRRVDILSIIIALIGTLLLATGGNLTELVLTPTALFLGIWCAFAAALYTITPVRLLKEFDAIVVCAIAMFLGGVCISPLLLVLPKVHLSAGNWLELAYIVVFGTMMAYTFFIQSVKYISPAMTGMLSAFEPLVATILAVLFLGTDMTSASIVGSILILLTTVLQSLPLRRMPFFHKHG